MPSTLSLAAIKLIQRAVDKLFDRAKARYLGPQSLPQRIYLGFRPEFSLPGIFHTASRAELAIPDQKILAGLIENAGNYLDAYRASTKAQVVKRVQAFLKEAELSGIETDLPTVLGGQLADVWAKTTNDVKRMIDTETTSARNMGTLEGIIGVNANEGIEDPQVFFVVVRDQHLCDECKRLHLMPDEITPRLWYLSELGHGYHKRGEDSPKVSGLHPHCRCTMVTMMPGYGFDAGGMVKFKGLKYDEMAAQRGGLKKSLPEGIETFKKLQPRIQENAVTTLKQGTPAPVPSSFLKAVKTAPVTVNLPPEKIKDLSASGRLRNLFEIGDGGGETHAKTRALQEERMFGIPHPKLSEDPSHKDYKDYGVRPLYGAVHYMHGDPLGKHAGASLGYGYAWLKLKPHVHQRSTFTHVDSFSGKPEEVFDASGLEHAARLHHGRYAAVRSHFQSGHAGNNFDDNYDLGIDGPYIEAQVHGGVDLAKDVDELHIGPETYTGAHRADAHDIEEQARELGRKHGVRVIAHRPPEIPRPERPGRDSDHKAYWDALNERTRRTYSEAQEHVLYDPVHPEQIGAAPVPDRQAQADQQLLAQLGVPTAAPAAPAGRRAAPKVAARAAGSRTSPRPPKAPRR